MRLLFAGTPDFAARHLAALLDKPEFEVVAVYTQPDRPAGRGKKLQPSAVKQLALAHDIPVEQPPSLKSAETQARLASWQADVMVVVAYGLILPQAVLDTPRLACVNVHGSLLPRWRGAAPIQRALWAGDEETGVAIMLMAAGLDTGPVLLERRLPISHDDTSASVYEKLAQLGPEALLECLYKLPEYLAAAQPQPDDQVSYAHKLTKEEAELDWQQPAVVLERWVRAFNPWPICWLQTPAHDIIKVWSAAVVPGARDAAPGTIIRADKQGIVVQTGDQALAITQLQPPGKKPMSTADFLNSRSDWLQPGMQLSSTEARQYGNTP